MSCVPGASHDYGKVLFVFVLLLRKGLSHLYIMLTLRADVLHLSLFKH